MRVTDSSHQHGQAAAVAGTWYPGTAAALAAAVDGTWRHADRAAADVDGELVALIAPHAGLMYSGPVAAHAYRLLRGRTFDVAVLVGPSHFVGFDGVVDLPGRRLRDAVRRRRDRRGVRAARSRGVADRARHPAAHAREHSLEMQLPFLAQLAPDVPIVPLVMGYQTAATRIRARRRAGGRSCAAAARCSSPAPICRTTTTRATAAALDRVVIDCVARFDRRRAAGARSTRNPEHACGGGPTVAVMRAARRAGARDAVVLNYADSGDVSGDKSAVVGYLAAAFGYFTAHVDVDDDTLRPGVRRWSAH